MVNKNYGILMSLGLIGIGIGIGSEFSSFWAVEQNWVRLLSVMGKVTICLYLICFVLGVSFLLTGSWRVERLNSWARRLNLPAAIRWLIVVGLLLVFTYFYLYSLWQTILAQPWTQLLFAMGLAQILLFIVAPQRQQRFGWSELALTVGLFLYPRVVHETRALFTDAMVYRAVTVIGFVLLLALIFVLYSAYGDKLCLAIMPWREQLGPARIGIVLLLCLTPILHRYLVAPETYILYDDIRFLILMIALWLIAFFSSARSPRLVSREALALSLGVLLFTSFLARASLSIMDYPFSLSWSEGNRFYDYSLVFGQSLYNYPGHIVNPYSSPGRYGVWGVLFLWQDLPIWAHRLWNVVLLTVPVLIFSALITRKLTPPVLRYGLLLWITLFLTVLAPLHPPFVIASAIAVSFAFDESLIKRGSSLAVASFYAGISRWTWVFAPAAIGVLVDLLLYYPKRTGPVWRRLLPSILLAGISLAAGLLPSINQYFSLMQGESLSSSQPLLWYRLLPNDTLGPGVLFLALRYTLPLCILLAWWIISKRWQLDWVQKIAIAGALIGFFTIGLVISTKIGGGGDLHNLDMFLITLFVVAVLGLMSMDTNPIQTKWSVWTIALTVFSIFWVVYPFLPLNPGSDYHPRLQLPNENKVSEAFSKAREEVAKFSKAGEVLFMDHRQLLTFHYLPPVPFVPEYEKKYMMDQAMANNARYFEEYYHDLAQKRFDLIVTEPLRTKRREELGGPFSEENDAWVVWVSNPTLCFYEPLYISTDVNLELLVPRQNPSGCEEYLNESP
ncbi:MAG TPA: hypothetical protein VFG81_00605 [Anaerolineales bacterium]|jgi:hypothetical protein|nr:hypothetical protein [Anaerolineales bacterium]